MVDQATFDAAFAAYIVDVDANVEALVAKAAAQAPQADFSSELAQLQAAKSVFDSAVNTPPAVDTVGSVAGDATGPNPVVVAEPDPSGVVVGDGPTGPEPPDANEQAAIDAQTPPADPAPAPDTGTPADGFGGVPADVPSLGSGPQTSIPGNAVAPDSPPADAGQPVDASVVPDAGDGSGDVPAPPA